jgi:hypothetical protein
MGTLWRVVAVPVDRYGYTPATKNSRSHHTHVCVIHGYVAPTQPSYVGGARACRLAVRMHCP